MIECTYVQIGMHVYKSYTSLFMHERVFFIIVQYVKKVQNTHILIGQL